MKALLLILSLSFPLCPSIAQSQATAATKQTKEELKAQQRAAKESKKQWEREQKDRLKRPAEIQIAGPSDEITARIVQHMNSRNYQIAEEGKFRILFTQEVTGFRGALAGGLVGAQGPPLRVIAFTVSQYGNTSTVTVDLSVQWRKAFGRVDRTDMNKNKEWRTDVESFLRALKLLVESGRQ